MTDKQFQHVLDKLTAEHDRYTQALKVAEDEYTRRFGLHPSEVEDDYWIDTYHASSGCSTVEQVTKNAEFYKGMKK